MKLDWEGERPVAKRFPETYTFTRFPQQLEITAFLFLASQKAAAALHGTEDTHDAGGITGIANRLVCSK